MENAKPAGTATGRFGSLKQDFLASIVVFLVALPLCMGIAIASGVPPEKAAAVGIISGIVGGLVVGFLAGCSLQVTGPAAGLAVIVGQLILEHGFATLGLIVMVAGVVQLIAGVLRLGQWFRAVSPAIIQGMLAGIGVLIFAGQFHVMVDDKPPGSGKAYGGIINLATIPEAVWIGLTEPEHQPAAVVEIVTILTIVGWSSLAPKRLKVLPAPLIAVTVATVTVGRLAPAARPLDPDRRSDAGLHRLCGVATGTVLGLGLAVVQLICRFTILTIRVERDRTTLYLKGEATFLRSPKLAQALQTIPSDTELNVHFEDLRHIDHACLDLLMKWEKQHEATGGGLVIDWESLTVEFRPRSEFVRTISFIPGSVAPLPTPRGHRSR